MTLKFVLRLQNWQKAGAFYFDFPVYRKAVPSRCLPSSERAHWGVCCAAQEDSLGLVCGCSRFQALLRGGNESDMVVFCVSACALLALSFSMEWKMD